ncbi:fluoride efflux transporter CrcB [Bacillota bacterium Lsc_1132]
MIYLLVGLGGILGSLLRYLVSFATRDLWNLGFPLGTLFINLTGAFLLGFITSRFVTPKKFDPTILTAFSTGVIGSYTTFSTFCLETVQLFDTGAYMKAFFYIGISLAGGLLFVHLGMQAGNQEDRSVREG